MVEEAQSCKIYDMKLIRLTKLAGRRFPLSQSGIKGDLFILILSFVASFSSCTDQPGPSRYAVDGVVKPEILLNGAWDFTLAPPETYSAETMVKTHWLKVKVPGGLMMQGFPIRHDSTYLYKKQFEVPADFMGHKILLRFDGVYSEAKAWVNSHLAGDHLGGFTRWELDVTDLVNKGTNELWVEVKDRWDDISWASGYAKHPIGGILRDVTLRAIPKSHLSHFYVETNFDDAYQNAELTFDIESVGTKDLVLDFQLFDPKGNPVLLGSDQIEITARSKQQVKNTIVSPIKWDAEHPNLYWLIVKVSSPGGTYSFSEQIGFREIEVIDDQLMVNGSPVKLRGANRHDIHPTLGRMTTRTLDSLDVMLAKEANINWIRTSHYPPSDYFLQLCDREGIYVEDETAVCFVQTYRDENYKPDAFHNDPAYTDWFLGQMEEMVHWHRNHPSVIIWSIGNENSYGTNFQKSYDRIKELDPSRPAIFSFPGTVPDSAKVYDILSMHYVNYDGTRSEWTKSINNFSEPGIPTVHDEYAHVACYNVETLREDANVRVFWAESIDRMWSSIFNTKGALGAAIWCFVDETFMIPENTAGYKEWWGRHHYDFPFYTVGYGEWGIIDTWRRKKPEFWGAKKAYSPAKLFMDSIKTIENLVTIPAQNRFDHTDFSELTINYRTHQSEGTLPGVSLRPHEYGSIPVPIHQGDEFIELDFYKGNRLIDTYFIALANHDDPVDFSNDEVKIQVNPGGQVFMGDVSSKPIIKHAKPLTSTLSDQKSPGGVPLFFNWMDNAKVESASSGENGSVTTYKIQDAYVKLRTSISGNEITFDLSIDGTITDQAVREIGIELSLADIFDSLSWERGGYWTKYPGHDLGALKGKISLNDANKQVYRQQPGQSWAMDTKSFYYHGNATSPLPYRATSYKENIKTYSLLGEDFQISVVGNDSNETSARIFYDEHGELKLRLVSMLDYPNLAWGNYMRNLDVPDDYSAQFKLYLEKKGAEP